MTAASSIGRIRLHVTSAAARRGWLHVGAVRMRCAIGAGGITARKREGDGSTPRGRYRLERLLYRADRLRRPRCGLPTTAITPCDGWCDAVGDRNYNRAVRHPYPASAERLWRDDGLYDVLVVISHNRCPRLQRGGSAIFIHVAREGYPPTHGCVALARPELLRLMARCSAQTTIDTVAIGRPGRRR